MNDDVKEDWFTMYNYHYPLSIILKHHTISRLESLRQRIKSWNDTFQRKIETESTVI